MHGAEFETWFIDPIIKEILVKHNMHASTLGHLEKGSSCIVDLPDGSTKKNGQMIGLNTAAAIPANGK